MQLEADRIHLLYFNISDLDLSIKNIIGKQITGLNNAFDSDQPSTSTNNTILLDHDYGLCFEVTDDTAREEFIQETDNVNVLDGNDHENWSDKSIKMVKKPLNKRLRCDKSHRGFEINKTDAYLNAIYNVLIWDNPKVSFLALGLLHIMLWLIVQLELRFYGVFFLASLFLFMCDLCFERYDVKSEAEQTLSSHAMRQVGVLLNTLIKYLKTLRNENPFLFCTTMCGIFLIFIVIARNISGLALTYLILLAIFACPLIISRIPPVYLSNIKEFVHIMGSNEELLAESELLPFLTNKDLMENEDLDNSLTDKTPDSVPNSLIYGMVAMPSYLDAERTSLDGLEEEDLEFSIRSKKNSPVFYTPEEISSDSDSDHKSMNFESSHFNRDSSSEDENHYSKGLQFTETAKYMPDFKLPSTSKSQDFGILSNIAALFGSSLVSNIMKSSAVSNTSKRKNSDSDFEIIDTKEIGEF
ncbi:hypothetical protein FQR65_LT14676 [Abscondita terminalis]|nr:hypothetical protein FQR65_LT14676 [Abscondita terminalis]